VLTYLPYPDGGAATFLASGCHSQNKENDKYKNCYYGRSVKSYLFLYDIFNNETWALRE
jgi:hypothetical protein